MCSPISGSTVTSALAVAETSRAATAAAAAKVSRAILENIPGLYPRNARASFAYDARHAARWRVRSDRGHRARAARRGGVRVHPVAGRRSRACPRDGPGADRDRPAGVASLHVGGAVLRGAGAAEPALARPASGGIRG